jgi:aromatic-L-amino-acid/L-tryptophan decarboxylase
MANRTIAIGDVHGCANALQALLDVIKPDSGDTLITLGDYVDRGPESSRVLEILTELISVCHLIPLIGNHEVMLQNALKSRREFEYWMFNGGKSTVDSYGGDLNRLPMHHRTFLKFCKRYHETPTHIFVHAAYDSRLPMSQQPDELLLWRHIDENYLPEPHVSGKKVICGHTPQADGEVLDLGHIKIVDTFCYGDRWLTALDVNSGEYIQARTDGSLRSTHSAFRSARREVPGNSAGTNASWTFTEMRPSSLELNPQQFSGLVDNASEKLSGFLEKLESRPVLNNNPSEWKVDDLVRELDEPLPESGTDSNALLDRLIEQYIPTSFNTASHGYLAYIPGGGLPDSAVADLISGVTNRFVTLWEAAPAMARIEATVIRWFCEMMGYPRGAGGFLTSGGSLANMSAIVVARTRMCGDDFRLARIYSSSQCHHCIPKAAFLAGFPKSAVRKIDVNPDMTVNLDSLQKAIDADRAAGFQPAAIVANAGTTNTGAIDDLPAIRRLCDRENLWMHADAAYGGFFMVTDSGKARLGGIATADSIVLDPHKGLFLPYGTGCLLVRDRSSLLPAFRFTSDYMPETRDDPTRESPCEISPELSRDNRALRIWFPVKRHGFGVFRQLLNEKLSLANWAQDALGELGKRLAADYPGCGIEIHSPPQLTIVPFRLTGTARNGLSGDVLNRQWLAAINRLGSVMLSATVLNGKFTLRICVLSFRTHIDRMKIALSEIEQAARSVLG